MMGVMTSPTSEFTIDENAAPMITPMARSMTLPRNANFLNSSIMSCILIGMNQGALSRLSETPRRGCPAQGRHDAKLVDQPRVHHRLAYSGLRLLGCRHHRQPHRVGAFADERHRVLDRRRTRLDEQIGV